MEAVHIEHVSKSFGPVRVIPDLSLNIHEREFVTLLGPSGCGKTTTLRMVAGFVRPDSGRITVGERRVVDIERGIVVPPEKRDMGMVFQSYAVWPHMTVFQNVAYPLRLRRVPQAEMQRRVEQMLAAVRLAGYENRHPHQLSGGQQQRVALARALVMEPSVLLLDEPLSNLDAQLRENMRFEIKDLQRRLGVTIIYVTHDQGEAMAMSDRVVVMREGEIAQVGTPVEIYERPANSFVAEFVGVTNLIDCEVVSDEGAHAKVRVFPSLGDFIVEAQAAGTVAEEKHVVSVRPEQIGLVREGEGIPGTLERKTYLGNHVDYQVRVGDAIIRCTTPRDIGLAPGEPVGISLDQAWLVSAS